MNDPIIQIKSLSKVYPGQLVPALKNVNLSIKRRAIFGVIGTSGAGKTTLLRCLSGLENPTEGEIAIEGRSPIASRKNMGMIFQHFNLFSSRNALENVTYPLQISGVSKEEAKRRGHELLSLVRLSGKEGLYPSQLSGGEKQRVAIARALAKNPAILFSDEATSALDPPNKKEVLSLLLELNHTMGLTIFLITHEMEVIKQICTDVAVLEKGEVVEEGSVEKLFSSPEHGLTKRFLQTLIHDDIPEHVFDFSHPNTELLRLYFKGDGAKGPVISRMVKRFQVEVNILLGGLDCLRSTVVGNLLISLEGTSEERQKAHRFLEEEGVKYEAIKR